MTKEISNHRDMWRRNIENTLGHPLESTGRTPVEAAMDAYVNSELTGRELRQLWRAILSGFTPEDAEHFKNEVYFETNKREQEKKEDT